MQERRVSDCSRLAAPGRSRHEHVPTIIYLVAIAERGIAARQADEHRRAVRWIVRRRVALLPAPRNVETEGMRGIERVDDRPARIEGPFATMDPK